VVGSEIDVANSHFGVHLASFLGTRKKHLGTRRNILATSAFTILGLLSPPRILNDVWMDPVLAPAAEELLVDLRIWQK